MGKFLRTCFFWSCYCSKDIKSKMADTEPQVEVEVEAEAEVKVEEEAPLDPTSALQKVLRISLYHDGLARGLREAVKALDKMKAHLCILAKTCNEPGYTKLITALCTERKIPLYQVENGKQLGEWAGLCKWNSEGKAVKVVGCSCVVIESWGEESAAKKYIMDHVKNA